MSRALTLRVGTGDALATFVARQLNSLFPGETIESDVERLRADVPLALDRMRPILESVRMFDPTVFDHFNSLQYSSFLYLLANEGWRLNSDRVFADRLFCLNRALNSVDLFYAVTMPEVFFLSHGLGAVLGNASYGERLVVFQHVTVGRVGDARPSIGSDVVLYPGATVTGHASIGERSVVAAGTVVHNVVVPPDSVVSGQGGELLIKPRTRDYMALYLRAATCL
jgi:serine O-acetyltransferase